MTTLIPTNSNTTTTTNPVPETLSDIEREKYTKIAKNMTEALLEATDLLGKIPWRLVHERHGLSIFRTELSNVGPCNVHAVSKFVAQIEDVTESLITNTTESYKYMMRMSSSDFIDGAVLCNIVEQSPAYPYRYVGLKWAAFKASGMGFSRDKDFVILEYVDLIEDGQGQKISFRVMQSVNLPASSNLVPENSRFMRESVPLMGFIYYTTKKPGELRMTYTCNFDKNGELPTWTANSAILSHVEKCINKTLKYLENRRVNRDNFVLPQQVIPLSNEQDTCHVCERQFGLIRHRYNCLKCGKGICSGCSSLRTAEVPDVGERKLRVCTACVIEVRRSSRRGSADIKTFALCDPGTGHLLPQNSTTTNTNTTPPPLPTNMNTTTGANATIHSNYKDQSTKLSNNTKSNNGTTSQKSRINTGTVPSSDNHTTSNQLHTNNTTGVNNYSNNTTTTNTTNAKTATKAPRRSFDDLLEPVKARLSDFQMFSAAVSGMPPPPRSTFPVRSLSDGLSLTTSGIFGGTRRGSPGDLSVSIEDFKQSKVNGTPSPPSDTSTISNTTTIHTANTINSSAATTYSSNSNVAVTTRRDYILGANQMLADPLVLDATNTITFTKDETQKIANYIEKSKEILELAENANKMAHTARKLSLARHTMAMAQLQVTALQESIQTNAEQMKHQKAARRASGMVLYNSDNTNSTNSSNTTAVNTREKLIAYHNACMKGNGSSSGGSATTLSSTIDNHVELNELLLDHNNASHDSSHFHRNKSNVMKGAKHGIHSRPRRGSTGARDLNNSMLMF